eukprot:Plantae.Rhodophyta-Purpureofilum_apyrenoidigerum.ctg31311.p1 GENE.Plantae.Rhodophyta-Purpureofilum_apyrenoidigerum.ctg31311~~Plantae.Rhodophyta-Purpureofilum_apyrenoidigerum.ctg31311.p1  ORF type:complete len:287 (-),score=37.69 Plantae.Rhodophyta-Purpureofilum_apyrenoidigerum.ctg31311:116-976(-)
MQPIPANAVAFCGAFRGVVSQEIPGQRVAVTRSRKCSVRFQRRALVTMAGESSSHLDPVSKVLFGPLFEPLNSQTPEWLRYIVWIDFRLAVILFVGYPLWLFISSFSENNDALKRVMIGYWQASSLLMLTVFLNISEEPIGTFTGLFVQIMILFTLWWWKDLVDEIKEENTFLSKAFLLWRWPATVLSVFGVTTQLNFQRCMFVPKILDDKMCAPWLEPPFNFKDIFLPFAPMEVLSSIAYAGLFVYFGYLAYYVAVPLRRVGRLGRKERNCFSSVSLLRSWGWIR